MQISDALLLHIQVRVKHLRTKLLQSRKEQSCKQKNLKNSVSKTDCDPCDTASVSPRRWKAPEAGKPWSVYIVWLPSNLGPWKPQVIGRPSGTQAVFHEKSVIGVDSTEPENFHKMSVVYQINT